MTRIDDDGYYVKEAEEKRMCQCGRNWTRNRYRCSECWSEMSRWLNIYDYALSIGRVYKREDEERYE